jgi:hypothetical protein
MILIDVKEINLHLHHHIDIDINSHHKQFIV